MGDFYPATGDGPHQRVIHGHNSPLRYLEIDRLRLAQGEEWSGATGPREAVIVPLSGDAVVTAAVDGRSWGAAIARDDVFVSPPSFVYLPQGAPFTVAAEAGLEAVLVSAPALSSGKPQRVGAEAIAATDVGTQTWRRQVRMLLGPQESSSRLLVGETLNPPGHWSGMPPHKHDAGTPQESQLEEIYYFRLSPPEGFGVQFLYDRHGWSSSVPITGEGAVAIPRGYHPTVAAPGTTLFYLWALAGPVREFRVTVDAAFAWMQGAGAREDDVMESVKKVMR